MGTSGPGAKDRIMKAQQRILDAETQVYTPVRQGIAQPRVMQKDAERCRTGACAALHRIELPRRIDAISRNDRPQRRRQTAGSQRTVFEVPKGAKLNGDSEPPQRAGHFHCRAVGFPLLSLTQRAIDQ